MVKLFSPASCKVLPSYQSMAAPEVEEEADRVTVPGPHLSVAVTLGAFGIGFTVTVTVAHAEFPHPFSHLP